MIFVMLFASLLLADTTTCQYKIKSLQAKKEVEVIMAFGYKDARPARYVGDRYERNIFVQEITKACGKEKYICGFDRDSKDGNRFSKQVGKVKYKLKLIHSSVTEDDRENRELPHQSWLSKNALNRFIEALTNADVVFYNGHSRNGGGPDFHPPVLLKDERVNYPYYQKSRSSFKKMLQRIEGSVATADFLGFFSCKASRHFESGLVRSNKKIYVLADNQLIYYWDALQGSLNALKALMKGDCKNLLQPFEE